MVQETMNHLKNTTTKRIISLNEIINQSNYGDEWYYEEVRKELEKP